MPSIGSRLLVFITGANTGLGFETSRALFARPDSYHILVGCRGDLSRAFHAIDQLHKEFPESASTAEAVSIDISSDDSIQAAFRQIDTKFGSLDILVNNAGADLDLAMFSGRLSKREGWNQTWDTNVTGTHILTEVFAPLLLASHEPRLIFITSGLSCLTEHASGISSRFALEPPGWPKKNAMYIAYRASKSGLNMVATEWARVLRNDGVKVFNISPGFLNTGLSDDRVTGETRNKAAMGALDPAVGAELCADVIGGRKDDFAWPMRVLKGDNATQPW